MSKHGQPVRIFTSVLGFLTRVVPGGVWTPPQVSFADMCRRFWHTCSFIVFRTGAKSCAQPKVKAKNCPTPLMMLYDHKKSDVCFAGITTLINH